MCTSAIEIAKSYLGTNDLRIQIKFEFNLNI